VGATIIQFRHAGDAVHLFPHPPKQPPLEKQKKIWDAGFYKQVTIRGYGGRVDSVRDVRTILTSSCRKNHRRAASAEKMVAWLVDRHPSHIFNGWPNTCRSSIKAADAH